MDLIKVCVQRFMQGKIEVPGVPIPSGTSEQIFTSDSAHVNNAWGPLFQGLAAIISDDPRNEVREKAFQVLFDLLEEYGSKFTVSLWRLVFTKYLVPIFDNVTYKSKVQQRHPQQALPQTPASSQAAESTASKPFYKVCLLNFPFLRNCSYNNIM